MADNINLGKIVLNVEGQRNNINSILNDINSYKNALSEIPDQGQNMRNIYNISKKIRELESYKRSKSNNAELELLRQDLAQAQLNKNIHNKTRKFLTIEQKKLKARLRSLQSKENETRYGGKHRKTHKRHINKRNKTKRNRN